MKSVYRFGGMPQSYFYALNISSWIQDLLLELEHRKALCFSDQLILNL